MVHTDHLNEVQGSESKLGHGTSSIGELVAKITAQISAIVRDELKFAALQGKAKITKLGIGGALFAVAALLGLYLLGGLFLAAVYGFALIVPLWLAYLIVSGIILLLILILLGIGITLFKASGKINSSPVPGFKKDFAAVKKGFRK